MLQLRARGLDLVEREYRFHPVRRWRFDFAWPDVKIAVEVEGGAFVQGRHGRGAGITNDCEKYNHAAMLGWRVLRGTSPMIRDSSLVEHLMATLGGQDD